MDHGRGCDRARRVRRRASLRGDRRLATRTKRHGGRGTGAQARPRDLRSALDARGGRTPSCAPGDPRPPNAARVLGRTPEAVRRRARKLALEPPPELATTRSGGRWTAAEDELLELHAALNPSVLAGLLGRSDGAVVARLRRLGLRAGRWRSPHHPIPANRGLTPGERVLVDREVREKGSRALLSLEQRLERPLGQVSARQPRPRRLATDDRRAPDRTTERVDAVALESCRDACPDNAKSIRQVVDKLTGESECQKHTECPRLDREAASPAPAGRSP